MQNTAKVFINGNSQAIRLPKDDDERLRKLNQLFKLIEEDPFIEDFLPARNDAWAADPFADGDAKS